MKKIIFISVLCLVGGQSLVASEAEAYGDAMQSACLSTIIGGFNLPDDYVSRAQESFQHSPKELQALESPEFQPYFRKIITITTTGKGTFTKRELKIKERVDAILATARKKNNRLDGMCKEMARGKEDFLESERSKELVDAAQRYVDVLRQERIIHRDLKK